MPPRLRLPRHARLAILRTARAQAARPCRGAGTIPGVRHNSSGLSISFGPTDPPLLTQTIPEHFSSIVSQHGDRPAVISRSPTTTTTLPSTSSFHTTPARETVLSYDDLDRVSDSLAHSLRALGVRKGDPVAVSLGNCPEFAALTYAAFKLGAVLVPLNPAFGAAQIVAALAHLEVGVLVVGAVTDLPYKPCRGRDNLPLIRALVPDLEKAVVESPGVPTLRHVVVVDNTPDHPGIAAPFPLPSQRALTPFSALAASFSSVRRPVVPDSPLSPDDTVNVQFTSGTTSQPKAAMLTHTNILNNGALVAHRMGLVPRDKVVCPPPLFHCFGCVLGYMATATSGSAIIFPSPAFDPVATLLSAAEHKATALYGVATMFVSVLDALASNAVLTPTQAAALPGHLRTGIAAGSSVPETLMRRLFAALGVPELVICYGMTETSPVSLMTAPADPLSKRTGTVGRAMPHTAVKIVDPADRTRVVARGERGEIAASGYLVMKGYWGDEARTREVRVWAEDKPGGAEHDLPAGATVPTGMEDRAGEGRVWMLSGDEGVMDEDGYVAVTGRIKDLIIRGGENIHPLEVEDRLFQHPLVAEASVVGVEDERYGEVVGAFVVAHKGVRVVEGGHEAPGRCEGAADEAAARRREKEKTLTKDDLRRWVRAALPGHVVPRYVFWVDEFPKTASGKIQKFKLREMAGQAIRASGQAIEASRGERT